jgi:hypothetical protein
MLCLRAACCWDGNKGSRQFNLDKWPADDDCLSEAIARLVSCEGKDHCNCNREPEQRLLETETTSILTSNAGENPIGIKSVWYLRSHFNLALIPHVLSRGN